MGAALGAEGEASCPPREGDVASELIRLLAQRPKNTLPLSDLDALLSAPLRQLAHERGGLASWLRCFPQHFVVSEHAGSESVSLSPAALRLDQAGADDDCALTPPQTPRDTDDIITPLKETPGGKGQLARCPDDAPVCPGADAAAWRSSGPQFDDLTDGQFALQMRGLPYRATVEDIRAFLGDFASTLADEDPIHLVLNRDGRPSGFARVLFTSAEAAVQCRDHTHLRSMQDRYVEVFLYSDRPRARNRRGGDDSTGSPLKDGGGVDSTFAREQVMRECREVMADPRHGPRMLLSTLGAELSASARACVKQIDNGLKHFLAQHPDEFSVDGTKGCEHVTYAPAGWRPTLDGARRREPLGVPLQLSEVLSLPPAPPPPAPPAAEPPWEPAPPGSPKPPGSPAARNRHQATQPTPKSALVPPTPSSLGFPHETPSRYPSPYRDIAQWPPQGGLPPWPGAPSMPPPMPGLPGTAATGVAGADGFVEGFADSAAFAAMASAMASAMAATTWAPPPAWPMPTPPLLPNFVPTAQAPWGAMVPDAATQPGGMAAAAPAPEVGATEEGHQACKIWPGQPGADCEATLGSAVRLRGLPFSSTEQDVLAFFAHHGASERIADGPNPVNLIMRANGRPSGQAVVQMHSRSDAVVAQRLLDSKYIGNRYIEVFLHVDGDLGSGAATGEGVSTDAQRPPPVAGALEAPSAQTAMAATAEGQPVQGQVIGLPDFSAQLQMPPQLPMDAWGSLPPMGAGAVLPGIAAAPAMGSDWSTLFASLSGSLDAAHLCPPLPVGEAVPPAGPLAETAAA